MEFPRFVYRLDPAKGTVFDPRLGRIAVKGVADAAEHGAALKDGWVDSVPELTAPAVPADDAPPTREEMLAQAEKLGIEVDKRWGDKRLMAAIEAAMA